MHRKVTFGFSLVELMVVLTVFVILAVIVYPNFINHMTKSRRTDAIVALGMLSMEMEKFYAINNKYTGATLGASGIYENTSNKRYYNLSIDALSDTNYTIKAAVNASLEQKNDTQCYNLFLDSTGIKSSKDKYNIISSGCW